MMTDEMWAVVLLVAAVLLNGSAVFLYQCASLCVCTYCSKDLCSAADCPDYGIKAVADCSTPSSPSKATILFLAMGIYIIQILPAAKINIYIYILI